VVRARRRPARPLQQHGSESSWSSLRSQIWLYAPANGNWRATAACDGGSGDVDQCVWLSEQGSELATAEELMLAVKSNARVASRHGDDGDWVQRTRDDRGVEEKECRGVRDADLNQALSDFTPGG